eukprot:gnl/TRDRNA2_/TRDRNA2_173196_c0_seq3.p1 gnl/TRDRNA2_/TRDRNA2_173196_c0~~gnl/TRDRNA2_/TRDRNA2_173196_c0_seq3.p1  ORF type:complete len:217 (+),score=51.03 gnl/TRDRNA2_/TRDRNA2_173196_c0_seq3:92-652(+)
MKNNEDIVLAALHQNGMALEFASHEMKNKEMVVLAAVHQLGQPIRCDSQETRDILLGDAVQNYASEEMKNRIWNAARKFDICVQDYAQAMLNPMLVQIAVSKQSCTRDLGLTCYSLSGKMLAAVMLQLQDDEHMLRQKIADAAHPPHGAASLNIVLPGGQHLRDFDTALADADRPSLWAALSKDCQ